MAPSDHQSIAQGRSRSPHHCRKHLAVACCCTCVTFQTIIRIWLFWILNYSFHFTWLYCILEPPSQNLSWWNHSKPFRTRNREASRCTETCRVEAFWLHWGSPPSDALHIPFEFSCQQALVLFACRTKRTFVGNLIHNSSTTKPFTTTFMIHNLCAKYCHRLANLQETHGKTRIIRARPMAQSENRWHWCLLSCVGNRNNLQCAAAKWRPTNPTNQSHPAAKSAAHLGEVPPGHVPKFGHLENLRDATTKLWPYQDASSVLWSRTPSSICCNHSQRIYNKTCKTLKYTVSRRLQSSLLRSDWSPLTATELSQGSNKQGGTVPIKHPGYIDKSWPSPKDPNRLPVDLQ